MATTRQSSQLTYGDVDEPDYHVWMNANLQRLNEILSPLAVDFAEYPSASLNVKVAAGGFRKSDSTHVAYAGAASFAVGPSATGYLYLTDSGTLTIDYTGWPAAAHVRLAVVVTGASTVTSIADARVFAASYGAGIGSYLPLGGGSMTGSITMAGGANLVLDTSTGSRIGTAVSQKLGFFNATPVVQPSGADQGDLTDSTSGDTTAFAIDACTVATAITDSSGGTASDTIASLAPPAQLSGTGGGTADGSMASIPDPSDSPATADALRDDLVANVLPRVRDDIEELKVRVNDLIVWAGTQRNATASLAAKANECRTALGVANRDFARVTRLLRAVRSGLVTLGLAKGSA